MSRLPPPTWMIRVFLSTWARDGDTVRSRIQQVVEAQDPGLSSLHCWYFYGDLNILGEPTRDQVIVIVGQERNQRNPQGRSIEVLANVSGVYMLPPYRLDAPITSVNASDRSEILSRAEAVGIPRGQFAGIDRYGQFLRQLFRYYNVRADDIPAYFRQRPGAFG